MECGHDDTGYGYTAADLAARHLIRTMNTSSGLLSGLDKTPAGPEIGYVIDEPTGPWQVVVAADNDFQVLWIEGYGNDLELPLLAEEVPCRSRDS